MGSLETKKLKLEFEVENRLRIGNVRRMFLSTTQVLDLDSQKIIHIDLKGVSHFQNLETILEALSGAGIRINIKESKMEKPSTPRYSQGLTNYLEDLGLQHLPGLFI